MVWLAVWCMGRTQRLLRQELLVQLLNCQVPKFMQRKSRKDWPIGVNSTEPRDTTHFKLMRIQGNVFLQ